MLTFVSVYTCTSFVVFLQLLVDKVKMLMSTAAARQIANGVLSETLVIISDSFAADLSTVSARQLSNHRGNFKVCSKEKEEPKPNVFWCSNHRALIKVTDLESVRKQAVPST